VVLKKEQVIIGLDFDADFPLYTKKVLTIKVEQLKITGLIAGYFLKMFRYTEVNSVYFTGKGLINPYSKEYYIVMTIILYWQ